METTHSKSSIREVAKLAGVSIATVSRVLNNSTVPTTETRGRVFQAVQQLNYEPDEMFRQAVQQRRAGRKGAVAVATQTIGYVVSDYILTRAQNSDGYYSRVLAGVQKAAQQHGYHLMLAAAPDDSLMPPAIVSEGRVDGLLIEGTFPPLLRDLLVKRLPVAFIDRTYPELPANSVMPHIEQAVQEILAYLWELGHRNIVTFQHATPSKHMDVEMYLDSFQRFFREKGAPIRHAEACRQRDITTPTHEAVMAAYAREVAALRPRPTAVVSWDIYACALLVELQRLGLRVPDDISIVGMDDVVATRYSTPQLTTYRFPMDELGRSATELLIEQIKDRHRPVRHLVVNGRIVERASCAPTENKQTERSRGL
jgi:DNA-binding LacI/PurR family transcriptional regulator